MQKEISSRLNENAALTDKKINEYLKVRDRDYGVLIDAMRYSASGGGKRVRPTLTLEFSRLFGGRDEAALPYACAIEMIHTYSLIHDDLPCMDNDDYRRGQLTNHRKFGEATALLAGDALLTYAFEVASGNPHASPEQNLNAVKLLSSRAGVNGMVGGQQMDLIGENEKLSYDSLIKLQSLKTGALISCACLLGLVASGVYCDEEKRKAAEEYAKNVGLAFQIEDDILDAGDGEVKTTFLTFMSIDEARGKIAELTEKAKSAISAFPGSEVLAEFADMLAGRKK